MSAQYGSLNRGDWKSLETLTRTTAATKDSIHVWCGNVGVAKKIGTTAVPTQCWKVFYIKKTKEWQAYLFNNTLDKSDGIENNKVDKKVIENLTGLTFE
jgi:DNA/RNA endonuclease G (NUC1)